MKELWKFIEQDTIQSYKIRISNTSCLKNDLQRHYIPAEKKPKPGEAPIAAAEAASAGTEEKKSACPGGGGRWSGHSRGSHTARSQEGSSYKGGPRRRLQNPVARTTRNILKESRRTGREVQQRYPRYRRQDRGCSYNGEKARRGGPKWHLALCTSREPS